MKWNLEEYKQETRKLILSIHWRKVLKHFPNPQQISKISVEPLNFGNRFCYQVSGLDGVKGRDTFAKIKTTCQNMIYGETFQIGFNKKSIGSLTYKSLYYSLYRRLHVFVASVKSLTLISLPGAMLFMWFR